MSKVILVNGSPHKYGCTFTALSEVKITLEKNGIDSEIIHIGNKPVRGCIACGGCSNKRKCVFEDDVCNELQEQMVNADGIVIGTPVYFGGPNGTLCALLDRIFFSSGEKFANKPAATVVSCRRGGASSTFDRLNKYFTMSNMPVVSSQYWNSVHGFTPDDVRKDLEGLQTMRTLANNMAYMIKSFGMADLEKPVLEAIEFTNFIR